MHTQHNVLDSLVHTQAQSINISRVD